MAEWYDGDPKLSTLFPVACPTCPEEEEQIVDELARDVQPRGVIVYVEAEPFCTQARGVREVISRTGMLGTHRAYNKNPHLADEFRLLIERHPAIRTVAWPGMNLTIETIFARSAGEEVFVLPDELRATYDGDLRIPEPPAERFLVVANFASTLDGWSASIYLASLETAQSLVRMRVTTSSWACSLHPQMWFSWGQAQSTQYLVAPVDRRVHLPRDGGTLRKIPPIGAC